VTVSILAYGVISPPGSMLRLHTLSWVLDLVNCQAYMCSERVFLKDDGTENGLLADGMTDGTAKKPMT